MMAVRKALIYMLCNMAESLRPTLLAVCSKAIYTFLTNDRSNLILILGGGHLFLVLLERMTLKEIR